MVIPTKRNSKNPNASHRAAVALVVLASTACIGGCSTLIPEPVTPSASAAATPTISPSVTVARGASAEGQPGCSSSFCAYVAATTAGFADDVSCSVVSEQGSEGFVVWTQGPSETKQSPNYYGYPDSTVTVTCTGGGQSASGSLTW